jgi:hypothetical protein
MMLHAVVFALGFAPLPNIDEKVTVSTPSPKIVVVDKVDKEKQLLTIQEVRLVPVLEERAVQENVGGQVVVRKQVVTRYQMVTQNVQYSLKDGKVRDTTGKLVPAENVLERIKAGSALLLVLGADRVDPAYLKIVSKDALILFPGLPSTVAPPPPPGAVPVPKN